MSSGGGSHRRTRVNWVITVVGALFIVLGAIQGRRGEVMEGAMSAGIIDLFLFTCPALVLLYSGYWLQ